MAGKEKTSLSRLQKNLHDAGNSLAVLKGNLEIALLYHKADLTRDLKRLIGAAFKETKRLKNLLVKMAEQKP